jgi:hypothetical protein
MTWLFGAGVWLLWAARPVAQTAPLPALTTDESTGFLTRAAWLLSAAPLSSEDPRFAWSMRSRVDVDLARHPRGRVNLLFEDELVLGRERREFDFNQGSVILETSASVRLASIETSLVFHHVSRHLIDRPAGRVVAWHTVGGRAVRPFVVGRATVAPSVEYHGVVQHTFVDYDWTSQVSLRIDRPFAGERRLFAVASGGFIGVDGTADRGRQNGHRVEAGVHLPGRRAALDLFAAHERRIDGYPFELGPQSWLEVGFRLSSK